MLETASPQSEHPTGGEMRPPPGQSSLAILVPDQLGPSGSGTAVCGRGWGGESVFFFLLLLEKEEFSDFPLGET